MKTPTLPPNHELLPADFLRQHGAVKGLRYHNPAESDIEWSYWNNHDIPERAYRSCVFCAPLGTIAAATTPVPEGKCNCHAGDIDADQCLPTCPAHPRNAYVHIPPHQLAQLPEKPEGLMWTTVGLKSWTLGPAQVQFPWMKEDWDIYGGGDFAYAVPRHVLDRIEQQLSTKGGDEPCAQVTTVSIPECTSNAAPESSNPTGEAAPSDIQIKPQEDRVIVTLGNGNYMDLYHTGIGVLAIINGPDKGIYEFQMKEDRK